MVNPFSKKVNKIPAPTIERLAYYSRPLSSLLENGTILISSEKIAELCGVNPAQVRKDLAYFGEFGVRGVGYDVRELLQGIKKILATDREWKLCIVGIGNLGRSLIEHENFIKRGYRIVAAFDSAPDKVGKKLPYGLTIEPDSKIRDMVREIGIEIGIISTPPHEAQRVADLLMDAGVKSILNFAPTTLIVPENVKVKDVDLSRELETLSYFLVNKEKAETQKA